MSTLVTTHDGLERVVRGGQAVADLLGRRNARPAVKADTGLGKGSRGTFATLIARMVERARQRRQDRLFEQLMQDDPRVYAEVQAAAARAEGR